MNAIFCWSGRNLLREILRVPPAMTSIYCALFLDGFRDGMQVVVQLLLCRVNLPKQCIVSLSFHLVWVFFFARKVDFCPLQLLGHHHRHQGVLAIGIILVISPYRPSRWVSTQHPCVDSKFSSSFFSRRFVRVEAVQLYNSTNTATALEKFRFILSEISFSCVL